MEDPTRFLLGHGVDALALHPGERAEGPESEVGRDRHGHPARDQRVAAEQRHEPGGPGGDDVVLGVLEVDDPQRTQIALALIEC